MKQREERPNPWMLARRASKCAYILLAIEDWSRTPECTDRGDLANAASRWDDAMWRRMAVAAGQHPPSLESKLEIVMMLRERARRTA